VQYECLWTELPIYQHREIIKYGYCLSPKKYPERELWFIAYKKDYENDDFLTHNNVIILLVDKHAIKPELFDYLGTDTKKWLKLCWIGIDDHYQWDDYKTGINLKSIQDYDRDFKIDNISNMDKQLHLYEDEIVTIKKSPKNNRLY